MYIKEQIKTKDGYILNARIYDQSKLYNGVILIVPSAWATQKDYVDFAFYFQQKGYCIITFDYRGVGDSAPLKIRGFRASLHQWAIQDTDAIIRFVKKRFSACELICVGHGIGGEIIGLAPASQYINKIVLINSALSCSRLRRMKDKIWIGAMKLFVKAASWSFGYFPGKKLGIMNDLPKGVMFEWINWCNNNNGLFDDFTDHNYRKLQVPLLAFSFSDDWRSQQSGVKALLEHFPSPNIIWHLINPIKEGIGWVGHTGFFKYTMQKVWDILLTWLTKENYEN